MTTTAPAPVLSPAPPVPRPRPTPWLVLAGIASLGAGVVHAAAAGAHGEHAAAAGAFTALAAAQLLWGGAALVRAGRGLALLGVLVGAVAVAGWGLAKTVGIPLVDGLGSAEPVQTADASAAALGLLSVGLATSALLRPGRTSGLRLPLAASIAAVTAVAALGTATAGAHEHAAGEVHAAGAPHAAGEPHVEPVPYDPELPLDLSGVPGVTPQQQAEAEALVARTLDRLPQWADPAVAEAAGFRSIGDGFTGHEHLIHEGFVDDDVILDPDRPESLVYDTAGGGRRLVAAMYMVAPGTPLSDVPDVGGALLQWHTHEDLCYDAAGRVAGTTDAAGSCPAGLVKPVPTPMVHVWITPHRCGPFAALDGIAGGTIPEGEIRWCDHAHGSTG